VERNRAVVVRAPDSASDSDIERVVSSKRQWILEKLRHPQKYQSRRHPPGKEVVNGESAPYLGRDYRIEIVETASGEIEFTHQFLVPPKGRAQDLTSTKMCMGTP
jgi:predicted metal-dependent hydrolase